MSNGLWEFIIGSVIVAVIFTLVRPGAPAAAAITDLSNALAGLIRTTTQYTASSTGTGTTPA